MADEEGDFEARRLANIAANMALLESLGLSVSPVKREPQTRRTPSASASPRKRKLDSSASDGAHHSPTKPHAGCGSPSSRQPTSVFTPLPGSRDGAAAGMVQFAPTAPHHAGQRQHDGSVHESAGTH